MVVVELLRRIENMRYRVDHYLEDRPLQMNEANFESRKEARDYIARQVKKNPVISYKDSFRIKEYQPIDDSDQQEEEDK